MWRNTTDSKKEQLLEKLVSSAPVAIAVVEGLELRYVQANQIFYALTGTTEASLVG